MSTTPAETLHRVPSDDLPRSSIDSNDSVSTAAHLISAHPPPFRQKGGSFTIYPTTILRIIIIILLIIAIIFLAIQAPCYSIPILIVIPIVILRTVFSIFYHAPLTWPWRGKRGTTLAVDAFLLSLLVSLTAESLVVHDRSWRTESNVPGCVFAWIASLLYIIASVDTGSPNRFAIKARNVTVKVDFSGERGIALPINDEEAAAMSMRV